MRVFSNCGEQRLLPSDNAQASHCGGFSFAQHGLYSMGSVVWGQRLHCYVVYGISLDQGLNLVPCIWQILTHCTTKEVLISFYMDIFFVTFNEYSVSWPGII